MNVNFIHAKPACASEYDSYFNAPVKFNVAKRLNMSRRNLQRKLQLDHTTFRTLLDEVRQEFAENYVHDSAVSLMEVAFILGYSDYSSFSRAYKRWTGVSPGEGRHEALNSNHNPHTDIIDQYRD